MFIFEHIFYLSLVTASNFSVEFMRMSSLLFKVHLKQFTKGVIMDTTYREYVIPPGKTPLHAVARDKYLWVECTDGTVFRICIKTGVCVLASLRMVKNERDSA